MSQRFTRLARRQSLLGVLWSIPQPGGLTQDPAVLNRRLRRRLSPGELFALALCFSLLFIFASLRPAGEYPYDFYTYRLAGEGDFSLYYYGYWFVPIFTLLAALPGPWDYLLWGGLTIVSVFGAARLFGGKTAVVLLTYQMLYTLFYGQFMGVLAGGLALLWWGMAHRRWSLAGLGMLIAVTKLHTGALLSLFLWLSADVPWRERWRVLAVPVLGALLSLWLYPAWPLLLLQALQTTPPESSGSLTLWRWLGPVSLLLWLPPLLLPFSREKRLILLVATAALAIPYFQQTDLLALFMLATGWLPLLGNFGFLFLNYGWQLLPWLVVIPLAVYLWLVLPAAYHRFTEARHARGTAP
jgi:hypothetical protein